MLDLISSGCSQRYAELALGLGYLYGWSSDTSRPRATPVSYIDMEDYLHPNIRRHYEAARQHLPRYCVLPDIVDVRDVRRTLKLAVIFSRYVERVIIVPKVEGVMQHIQHDGQLVAGYSVPTTHGGTQLFAVEFDGWDVHLLGGGPDAQMRVALQLAGSRIVSADSNYSAKVARFGMICQIGRGGKLRWVRADSLGDKVEVDVPYVAFQRSLINIKAAWERMYHEQSTLHPHLYPLRAAVRAGNQ